MFIETVALLAVIGFLIFKWAMTKANFFVDRNVKYDTYIPFLGMYKDLLFRKKSFVDMIVDLYRKFDGEQ